MCVRVWLHCEVNVGRTCHCGVILHCDVSPTMPNPTMLPTVGLIDTQITPINTVGLNLLTIPLPSLCHFGAFKSM